MKLIYMGTPDFAVPALTALHASRHTVQAVVTSPDKRRGRGQITCDTPVKCKALELGLPLLQPESLRDAAFLEALKAYDPDILVVVAFRILPPEVFSLPRYGAVNAHASLLPRYRGAAPINWAIYHGESVTGITIFRIARQVDTGSMMAQETIHIDPDDTAGTLQDKLMHLAAKMLPETLNRLEEGTLEALPQDDALATPAPKLKPDTGKLDLHRGGEELCRAVRAFTPCPGAFFRLNDRCIKVSKADWEKADDTVPGTIELLSKKHFAIHCGDGYFLPRELQSPGRRKMDVSDWMNGNKISDDQKVS
ncbi:MAG: methionyl-tRNA formyltransferase [FCB group bacterium]|nr:methionyl-tRNA formyltransferase [FCB group bacterium]